MDLIGELVSKLGVDPNAAQALAGVVVGEAQAQLENKVGAKEASELGAAIPELDGWKQAAASALGAAGGGGGGLLGAALGGLGGGGGLSGALGGALSSLGGGAAGAGGEGLPALVALLGKLNLDPRLVSTIAPIALTFLEKRLPKELLGKVQAVLPLLAGKGDVGSLLGGLLK